MIGPDTQAMLAWFALYFTTFAEKQDVEYSELAELVKLRSGGQSPDSVALTMHLVQQLSVPVAPESLQGILSQLMELDLAGRAGSIITRYNAGEEVELSFELQNLAAMTRRAIQEGGKASWADGCIWDYMEQEADEGGLQWDMIPMLASRLKGLRPGHNVAVAAPTDKGKTSLLCLLATGFAKQSTEMFGDRPLLYLVNESTAERVTVRNYQTALQMTLQQMRDLGKAEVIKRYSKIVHRPDAIRCSNIHGKSIAQVEDLIGRHNPYLVITDMTGRIKDMTNKGGMNDITQLENVWNCVREMSVIQDFAHLGTVQVSGEGFDDLYPPLSAMQNSKVGIQTTLDLCLMMGARNMPGMETLRGISTPKNKLARSGLPSENRIQLYFEPGTNSWVSGEI